MRFKTTYNSKSETFHDIYRIFFSLPSLCHVSRTLYYKCSIGLLQALSRELGWSFCDTCIIGFGRRSVTDKGGVKKGGQAQICLTSFIHDPLQQIQQPQNVNLQNIMLC